MQALILAAGMGSRLGYLTKNNTKCMIEVNGIRLIDRTIDAILCAGIKNVCIVTGYEGDTLKNHIQEKWNSLNISFVQNQDYETTNNIYSLFLAKDFLCQDDTILFESDVIFEKGLVSDLVNDARANLAVVDKYQDWMDGTVVDVDKDDYISSFISKQDQASLDILNYYKTVNIYKFSKQFSNEVYSPFITVYCTTMGKNKYYEEVLSLITNLPKKELYAFKIGSYKWYEIDDANDHKNATTMFSEDNKIHDEYSSRYGGYWKFPKIIDYFYLVNPYFPGKTFKKSLSVNFDLALTNYPSGLKTIEGLASTAFKVNEDYITVGNGVSEIIPILASQLNAKNVGVFSPSFDEYANRFNPLINVNSFYMTEEEIEDSIKIMSKSCDLIILVNPENPTGKFIQIDRLKNIIQYLDKKQCKIIIDESFIDFAGMGKNASLINDKDLSNNKNLIVLKSIGKSFGVPGLRLGLIASSNKEIIQSVRDNLPIWNINSFAEFFLQKIPYYMNEFWDSCIKSIEAREEFLLKLSDLGIEVFNSSANFFMIKLPDHYSSSSFLTFMIKENILIKSLQGKSGIPEGNYYRLAIRTKEENDLVVNLIKSYMVLFSHE